MAPPPADVSISAAIVHELLRQSPQYADRPIARAGHGWDNEMWRLGDELALRLPRRREAARLITNEIVWLRRVAAPLPVAVPVPVFAGRPTVRYRYPWAIVPWLAGAPAAAASPSARDGYAVALARALRALHVPSPTEAPHNPYRGVPLAERAPSAVDRLSSGARRYRPLLALLRDAEHSAAYHGPPVWLHGDPHPGNVLVDGGRLHALIDFGDLCQGDPASDLGVVWLHFTRSGRERFFAAYGAPDALQRRARGWAVSLATAIRVTDGTGPLAACAEHALTELLADL